MQHFKQYKTSKNDDGTINVHDLEIFKLGKHRGFEYDDEWADAAVAYHAEKEASGNLPSVIIGHNNGKEEKPSKGFLSKIRKNGDTIVANITKINPETFESLKKREFPHRSVEVNPQERRFTALALLGGTPPYHKLPVMEFGDTDGCEVIEFADTDLAIQMDRDGKLSKIRDIFWRMMDALESIIRDGESSDPEKETEIKDVLEQGTSMLKNESENYQEGMMSEEIKLTEEHSKLYAAKFAETHGMTPDEAAEKIRKFEEEAAARVEKFRETQIKSFAAKLKDTFKVAPAIVDEVIVPLMSAFSESAVVKFGEDDEKTGVLAFEDAITRIFEADLKSKLYVDLDEHTRHGRQMDHLGANFSDGGDEMDDRVKLHDQIKSYAEKHGISFSEAALKVVKNK